MKENKKKFWSRYFNQYCNYEIEKWKHINAFNTRSSVGNFRV